MNNKLGKILAEISAGELFDKISILEIKKTKIQDINKLKDISKELESLDITLKKHGLNKIEGELKKLTKELSSINLDLWEIEDGKRLAEKNNDFDENFIKLARNVYKKNDVRAKIKLEINKILGSNIKETKSYH
ncbi:DUF6165 family protein [Pelagibacteraceae bacterium]|nr:DUF6165 family protein [Pelagibacteraceae bacterium]